MTKQDRSEIAHALEQAATGSATPRYVLRLYVTGSTQKSARAIRTIKKLCEEELHDRYELEVIDLYQHPTLAKGDQIIAVPTLVKKLPQPVRRLIGDLANEERVLVGLNLRPRTPAKASP